MDILKNSLLFLLALAIILSMVSVISGILIAALKILVPLIVMFGGFYLALRAEDNLKRSRAA